MNLIVIKGESLEDLSYNISDAIDALYEMQDEIADQIERENWFDIYLRGPFWWL